jgi:radical SAM superfamily enzyme YgiQ (UPF0313 family)
MNRVCLITPPSVFLLDERVFMTLGILKVAACLEQAGHHVEMLDLSGVENFEEVVRNYLDNSDICTFGITATTPQMPATMKVVNVIRQHKRPRRIILGGPHATLVHAAFKREVAQSRAGRATRAYEYLGDHFDCIVAGDGEEAIFEAIKPGAPPLIDGDDPKTKLFLSPGKLTEMPFPARHLIDIDSYRYTIDGVKATSLIGQLGCPFECGFCGGRYSPSLRRMRIRSSENILAELRHLHETYGFNGFMFYDDELNVNKKWEELLHGIIDLQSSLGTEFRLRGFVKAELFTQKQAELMYRAGFRWLLTGFESGSPRILRNINKKATQDDNTRAVDYAHSAGLKVKALMSVGHPGESYETIQDTQDWLLRVKPEDFDVTIITTYPGSPYYDDAVFNAEKNVWTYTYNGDTLHQLDVNYEEVAEYYKGDPDGGYQAFVFTDYLSTNELVEARDRVEREVRAALNIPFNPGMPAIRYEHSMGQGLPANILRATRTS